MHTKTSTYQYFYEAYLVLITMYLRNEHRSCVRSYEVLANTRMTAWALEGRCCAAAAAAAAAGDT